MRRMRGKPDRNREPDGVAGRAMGSRKQASQFHTSFASPHPYSPSGRPVCKLHLSPGALHADIDGDGTIDHVQVGVNRNLVWTWQDVRLELCTLFLRINEVS